MLQDTIVMNENVFLLQVDNQFLNSANSVTDHAYLSAKLPSLESLSPHILSNKYFFFLQFNARKKSN